MSKHTTQAEPAIPFWRNKEIRAIFFQTAALAIVVGIGWYLFANTQANMKRQAIATGFGFLHKEASFEIGESMIRYSSADTYLRALVVGALNTLKVSFIGIILTVFIGTFIGICRLSTNWLLSRLAALYIEVMQNIPVLLQLFFWYAIFYEAFPAPRHALNPISGVFLCNRGLVLPVLADNPVYSVMGWLILFLLASGWLMNQWGKKQQERSGKEFPAMRLTITAIIVLPAIVWLVGGRPIAIDVPHLRGFNFQGGHTLSPEFSALLLGLVIYTSAFVAEIVRAGIQAVGKGQVEAAKSLGLRSGKILQLVILPQALRVIIPPLTSQLLNLTKNSSLAIAIGYADFVAVTNTTINQTGQAIEGVALIMLVFLVFSLSTSLFMNWYNKKTALIER